MKQIFRISAGIVLVVALLVSAQTVTTVTQNIQFQDMTGKQYDLYDVLNSGNYVFVEMMFNG